MSDLINIFGACVVAFIGGLITGMMWRIFRSNDRDSTKRFPRPGSKPYKRHKDMLNGDSLKKYHEDNET